MTTVDVTIVATALDTLKEELNAPVNWIGWTMTAYSFGFVLMLPLSAKLSAQFGARRLYLISVATFTFASLCCGLVNSIYILIPLRILQALGAAGITPSVTSIIVDHFGSARDRAVSLFGSIFPIGIMLGPIFGGLFVTYWSWRWIFFVNVPIGIAVILLSLKFIPHDSLEKLKTEAKMNLNGLLWLGIGLLAGMFAITFLGQENTSIFSFSFCSLFILSVGGLWQFFRHINQARQPFIIPRFVHGKGFGAVNLLNILYSGMTSGVLSLVPLYAANRYGINAMDSATLLIAQGAASVIFSTAMTVLLRRTGYRPPLFVGCLIIMSGIALLACPPLFDISSYFWLAGSAFFVGVGMGVISPPARNAGLQLAPEDSATIAALRTLCLQLGAIITIGIATAIIAGTSTPGVIQAWVFAGIAVIYLIGLPLITRIPEHKGAW